MHDSVRLCSDRGQVLATYPAEKLAFSACCPDDRRFFGLVTMQATDDHDHFRFSIGRDEDGGLRTSCHVFIVDPDLCHHQVQMKLTVLYCFVWLLYLNTNKYVIVFTIFTNELFMLRSVQFQCEIITFSFPLTLPC